MIVLVRHGTWDKINFDWRYRLMPSVNKGQKHAGTGAFATFLVVGTTRTECLTGAEGGTVESYQQEIAHVQDMVALRLADARNTDNLIKETDIEHHIDVFDKLFAKLVYRHYQWKQNKRDTDKNN